MLDFQHVFARAVNVAPSIGFRCPWCLWKAYDTLFLKVMDLHEVEFGLEGYSPENRGRRWVFGSPEGNFSIEIPARLGKILAIRELHVVSECVLFLKVVDLWIKSLWVGKNLCANVTSSGGKL